jgi:UDP-N-acetylmuramoyl-tripeptide--D-alanyl-D-alanine ligase
MRKLWESAELAAALGVADPGFDATGISFDTRSLAPGDLFVALAGARDGHDFVAEAFAKGAAGALVARPMPGRVIVVDNTLRALERLGAAARARSAAQIVAVTGSVGKTTTKEMLRRCLGGFGRVHAAQASFNNHIGVPLTLARLPREADFGVFEIGMNHPGEIAPLAALARPHAAIITCVDRAHLGLMGSEAAIAVEKAAIFGGLVQGGAAILPAASKFLALLRSKVPEGAHQIGFGAEGAEARLLKLKAGADASDISASIFGRPVKFRLEAAGQHMAENALAVLAAAVALGLDAAQAAEALDGFAAFAGRGARRDIRVGGKRILLLDESYNASQASMRAAFAVLALQPGRHVAVLGDMLELGEAAVDEHRGLAEAAAEAADRIFCAGPAMRHLFDSLPESKQGDWAPDAASLVPAVLAALAEGDAVLVKGSFGSRMRDVISALEGAK